MKLDIKKLPNCEVEIEIEVPKEEFDAFMEKAALELSKDATIEGFRKGKAPKNIIEGKIGKENILAEAAEMAIKENYEKAVRDNDIEPISQPDIQVLKLAQGSPLVFKAKTIVLPEVKLPDYKEIAASKKRNKIDVLEKEVEQAVNWLLKSRAKFTLKNGPVEKGDFVEINYSSDQIKEIDKKEGHKDSFVLGEGQFIPGFEDNLIGMKAGEEKEFSVTFPSDYFVKELAGKKVDFKVKLNSVQKVELPQMNDEFAKTLGKFDNVEALKNNIKEGIGVEKEQAESQKLRQELLKEISEKTEMEIPETLIEKEKNVLMHNFKHDIEEKTKVKFEEYLEKIKKTEKDIFDSFYEEAKKRVKEFLTLREIGLKEKIKVKEEEIKEEADKLLKHYTDVGHAEKDIDVEGLKNYTKEVLKNEKIFRVLEELVKKS